MPGTHVRLHNYKLQPCCKRKTAALTWKPSEVTPTVVWRSCALSGRLVSCLMSFGRPPISMLARFLHNREYAASRSGLARNHRSPPHHDRVDCEA